MRPVMVWRRRCVVSQTRTLVRGVCDLLPDPFDLLACANARLAQDLHRYVRHRIPRIHRTRRRHDLDHAGHGPLLIRESGEADFRELQPPAVPLGIDPDFSGDRMDPVKLQAGGLLAVISDGVFEARNATDGLLGMPGVIRTLDRHRADGPDAMLDALRQQVLDWQGKDEPADDQTVVLVEAAPSAS